MQGEEIMRKENKKHMDEKEDKKLVKKMVKKDCRKWREIQPAPFVGNIPVESIQRAVDAVTKERLAIQRSHKSSKPAKVWRSFMGASRKDYDDCAADSEAEPGLET